MRLVPMVVLLDEEHVALLERTIAPMAERLAVMTAGTLLTMRLNGWTPEAMAAGRLLAQTLDLIELGELEIAGTDG